MSGWQNFWCEWNVRRKVNWTGHILRKNCLIKHVIEGRIEVTGRRGRRRKLLLDGPKENKEYCKLKWEAVDRIMWRIHFGRGYRAVVRDYGMNEWMCLMKHHAIKAHGGIGGTFLSTLNLGSVGSWKSGSRFFHFNLLERFPFNHWIVRITWQVQYPILVWIIRTHNKINK